MMPYRPSNPSSPTSDNAKLRAALFSMSMLWTVPSTAISISGEVVDQHGQALVDAVVTAVSAQKLSARFSPAQANVELDQRNREFIPHVLVVPTGTAVNFPNNDKIHHHVYSFSPTKRFEIKLYKDVPSNPVIFDTPGIVVLGCNIHDWMISYVYVTDAAFFTKTDNTGHWQLDLPEAAYKIGFWHPDLQAQETEMETEFRPGRDGDFIRRELLIKRSERSGKPPNSLQQEDYKGEP